MSRLNHAAAAVLLLVVGGCTYSNSTPAGRTRADDRTIEDVRRAIALLQHTPAEALARMAEETSRRDDSYTGVKLKQLSPNTFEFFCWSPCKKHELIDRLTPDLLPELEKITSHEPDGITYRELWQVRIGTERKLFQVGYVYVPGGGGEYPILARKPDHLYVQRSQ